MEGIVLPLEPVEDLPHVEYPEGDFRRHFTPQQVAAIEAGIADIEAGRVMDHEVVVAELREKYGW